MTLVSLIPLFLSFLLSLSNVFLGLKISWGSDSKAYLHLVFAIMIVGLNILGSLWTIIVTKQQLEQLALHSKKKENFASFNRKREDCVRLSLVLIGISVVSILTGTSSSAGEIPWIHAAIGISLSTVSGFCLTQWIGYSNRLSAVQ